MKKIGYHRVIKPVFESYILFLVICFHWNWLFQLVFCCFESIKSITMWSLWRARSSLFKRAASSLIWRATAGLFILFYLDFLLNKEQGIIKRNISIKFSIATQTIAMSTNHMYIYVFFTVIIYIILLLLILLLYYYIITYYCWQENANKNFEVYVGKRKKILIFRIYIEIYCYF